MKFWQYFLFTIIGALLGFGLQFIIDNGGQSWVIVKGDYPSGLKETGHEGEKPYTWTYRLEGRSLELPKRDSEGNLVYPGVPELPENVAKDQYAPLDKLSEWKALWYQLRFLNWLQTKGDIALRTACFGALILPFCFTSFPQKHRRLKKR